MPNEVIAQIHCLAAAAEKYDGIVFTDIKGNILTEQFVDDRDTSNDKHTIASEATEDTAENYTEEQTGNNHINDDGRNIQSGTENENENDNTSNDDEDLNQSDQLPIKEDGNNTNDEDDVSSVNMEDADEVIEDPYEDHITIDDINIVTEMNMSQMATQQAEGNQNQVQTHGYNLRSRPTKWREQISLAIADSITGVGIETRGQYLTIHPKVHAHIMLMQLNIKQGLSTFGERGGEAVLKELQQLHHKKAL
jgi:hypothetical protein